MDSIALAPTNADATPQNCPTWCLRHDPLVEDLHIGPATVMDFGEPVLDFVSLARIQTYSEPLGGTDLTLALTNNVNGTNGYPLTPAQARQIGMALIQSADNATTGAVLTDRHLTLVHGGTR